MVNGSPCIEKVNLRGLTLADVGSPGPVIIKRTDQEFLDAVLSQLAAGDGLQLLAGYQARPPARGKPFRLYQPVHRVFNIALLEVSCDQFGQPRLDPQRILSAGMVLRREGEVIKVKNLADKGTSSRREKSTSRYSSMEGWIQSGKTLQGWQQFASPEHEAIDPDPQFRRPEKRAGHPVIDQLLSASPLPVIRENETRLFVAPPDVCCAANKTILYGLIPVTSSEQSEIPDTSMPAFSDDMVSKHLPSYLRAGGPRSLPRARGTLTYLDADTSSENMKDTSDTDDLGDFILMLRQLSVEFEAFKEPLRTNLVYQALNRIQLPFSKWDSIFKRDITTHRPAGDFLKDALDILVNQKGRPKMIGDPGPAKLPTITMPDRFPALVQSQADGILRSVKSAMVRRLGQVAGRQGRFDDQGRRYRVRAFVRLKGEGECPPVTVWSDYSEPFTIVPWYEGSEAPPVQVTLPEITPDFLQNLKPNISFILPESLFNMLNKNSPKDFIGGNAAQAGASLALDWICSFNIPIITICAFIVLNIFLQLFDIIFHWMMFIKICIPFPKIRGNNS